MKITFVSKTFFIFIVALTLSACRAGDKTPTLSPTEGAQMLAGIYITNINAEDISKVKSLEPNFSENQGEWKIILTNDGKFTAEKDGLSIASGKFTVRGDEIEFYVDQVCPDCSCLNAIGRYDWALKEGKISFTKIAGVCDVMDLVLTVHAITRQP